MAASSWVLPNLAVGPADVSRLHRELEAVQAYLRQASLRGASDIKLPKTSRMLDELVATNKLDLLQSDHQAAALQFLQTVLHEAPVVHISFAGDPSSAFTAKIIMWFRQQVHPLVLVQVGLQPSIAAGCVIRTTNKQYDLSVRKHFSRHQPILVEKLRSMLPA